MANTNSSIMVPKKLSTPLPTQHQINPSWNAENGSMPLPSDLAKPLLLPKSSSEHRGSIFLTSDDNALTKQIEHLHKPDARYVDVRPLFHLVEEIIRRASQGSSSLGQKDAENRLLTLNGLEEVPDLPLIVERISSDMTSKLLSGIDAHNTTLSVLNMLSNFSWEAKVVLTLSAFSLTFGDFWLLSQIYSTNALARSMAIIRRLPMVMEHVGAFRNQFDTTNNLISAMLETTRCMVEFRELPTNYISDEDLQLKSAMTHFPIAVYWIVRSAVAAATQITTMSSKGVEYMSSATAEAWELSNWTHKLKTISNHLRTTLNNLYRLIEEKKQIDAFNLINRIIYQTIHIDNIKVLKTLIYADDDVPPLYDAPAKRRVHLDVLRRKNVLLLISGLDITHEELYILEQSYNESKIHAYEIVWIPMMDPSVQWTESMDVQLENLKASMPWYSVHHPNLIGNAVIKFLRDDWHFSGKPILVVLDPQGKVLSPNAIHMMWIWQSRAFPFTSLREEALWEQETWRLELLVNGIDQKIHDWMRDEKYIFLYGGDDLEWIRKFTNEARVVARTLQVPLEMVYVGRSHNKELVRKVCAAITVEQLSHCWQDPTFVWYFWTRVESMMFSKIQLGKVHDHADIILKEIQRLHSHDKSHGGWAILAKGSNIVVHGQGKLALLTLQEMEIWREHALREGFEEGYGSHYKELHMREYPCHRIEFPSAVRIPGSMLCPECRRHMLKYNSFICCHEDSTAAAEISPAVAAAAAEISPAVAAAAAASEYRPDF